MLRDRVGDRPRVAGNARDQRGARRRRGDRVRRPSDRPSSAGVPGAVPFQPARRSRRRRQESGASSSRKRDEKKWQWVSLIMVEDRGRGSRTESEASESLQPHGSPPRPAPWFTVILATLGFKSKRRGPAAPGSRPAGGPTRSIERFVRVAENDDVGSVAREQLFGCRSADLVAVADVDRYALDLDEQAAVEARFARRVGVAVDRANRRDGRQLDEDRLPADVAGVQNQIDAAKRREYLRADRPCVSETSPIEYVTSSRLAPRSTALTPRTCIPCRGR